MTSLLVFRRTSEFSTSHSWKSSLQELLFCRNFSVPITIVLGSLRKLKVSYQLQASYFFFLFHSSQRYRDTTFQSQPQMQHLTRPSIIFSSPELRLPLTSHKRSPLNDQVRGAISHARNLSLPKMNLLHSKHRTPKPSSLRL